jgi:lipopolysaccharide/colanic/teichoic acid biosynthesis glycosyltransferase
VTSQLFFKRVFDIIGAAFGLCITAVVAPFLFALTKLEDGGDLFYSGLRVGLNGELFKIWKFRSMQVGADDMKHDLKCDNCMEGAIFKLKDDPRVTKVGRFIRKTSIDEFPQFWNVLKGEMSLVGTRPPTPDELAEYKDWHRRRIAIKPGITGLWQVSGRSSISDFDDIVKLDLEYISKWNLWLDFKIILKTVFVVFTGKGSY